MSYFIVKSLTLGALPPYPWVVTCTYC